MLPKVQARLDDLYRTFDDTYIQTDPLRIVRRFTKPLDQEIMAVVTSSLAFGQVQQINKAAEHVLQLMKGCPADFVTSFDPVREIRRWRSFYYRMVRHSDLLRLLFALQHVVRKYGRLRDWAKVHYDAKDYDLGQMWSRCVQDIRSLDLREWTWRRSSGIGFRHLLPDPSRKSACKRAHLLLRWMVRKDHIDLGLWSDLPASKLLIPVDTHVQRIAYNIGLTDRKDSSATTSKEITSKLSEIEPTDPVKYDFAICRLGILKLCPKKRDPVKCRQCQIFDICRL